jgi:hypothetical protein
MTGLDFNGDAVMGADPCAWIHAHVPGSTL